MKYKNNISTTSTKVLSIKRGKEKTTTKRNRTILMLQLQQNKKSKKVHFLNPVNPPAKKKK
jgi:hypothetical protein